MWYRLQKRMALFALMVMLGAFLAACGGDAGTEAEVEPVGSPAVGAEVGEASEAPLTAASPEAEESVAASMGAEASMAASMGAEATGEANTAGGDVSAACPDAAQGQQITMWSPLTGPDGDEMTAIANEFSQNNPQNITVQHVPQPEYLQKLNTAAAGGNLPDLTVIRISDVGEMAARGVLQPMNEELLNIVSGGGDLAADFPEAVWQGGEYNGERYSIPLDVNPLVLYYNTEMFEAAGIEMPTDRPMTREEFEAAAQALNQDGVAGIAIGNLFNGETMFETLLAQFGGQALNDESTEAAYNSEAGVEALTYLRDLKQQYSPNISGTGDPEVTQFQQGRAAMVIHGPWHISNLQQLPFTGFAQVPQFGDEYAVQGGSHQLAVTATDPAKQAAAACWIGWLSENSVQWAASGLIPVRESARADEAQLESVNPVIATLAPMADAVVLPPSIPGAAGAQGAEGFGRAVNPVLLGQQTDIQAALEQAAQRTNQLLEQNAQQYSN